MINNKPDIKTAYMLYEQQQNDDLNERNAAMWHYQTELEHRQQEEMRDESVYSN